MKGQASYPFSMIEAVFTFILLMSVAYGGQSYTTDYFKEETIDIRADRVERSAILLESYPAGSMELDLNSYEFKVEASEFIIKHGDINDSRNLDQLNYTSIEGPSEFESFDNFCLQKNFDNELVIGGC